MKKKLIIGTLGTLVLTLGSGCSIIESRPLEYFLGKRVEEAREKKEEKLDYKLDYLNGREANNYHTFSLFEFKF